MSHWREPKLVLIVGLLLAGAFAAGHLTGLASRRAGPGDETSSRAAFLAEVAEVNAAFAREWVAARGGYAGEQRTLAYAEHCGRLREAQRAVYLRHGRPLPEHLVGE